MKVSIRSCLAGAVLATVAMGNIGCQTYEVGQVLPSGFHMRDDLLYIPKGPHFPLSNELNSMQQAESERQDRTK